MRKKQKAEAIRPWAGAIVRFEGRMVKEEERMRLELDLRGISMKKAPRSTEFEEKTERNLKAKTA